MNRDYTLDVAGESPAVVDSSSRRVVARSLIEFFALLKGLSQVSPEDAWWYGMCMAYLVAEECLRLGDGITSTALAKRSDAVSFPFMDSDVLRAFHGGLREGEETLLRARTGGSGAALEQLAVRLT